MITASKVQDIQNHTCSSERKKVRCTVVGCDKKFFTQITVCVGEMIQFTDEQLAVKSRESYQEISDKVIESIGDIKNI